jgi:hypothetical protein
MTVSVSGTFDLCLQVQTDDAGETIVQLQERGSGCLLQPSTSVHTALHSAHHIQCGSAPVRTLYGQVLRQHAVLCASV